MHPWPWLGRVFLGSFSEEKEPKRLFAALRGGCELPKLGARATIGKKSFCFFFFRKRRLFLVLSGASPLRGRGKKSWRMLLRQLVLVSV
jgi:hypothetical protein